MRYKMKYRQRINADTYLGRNWPNSAVKIHFVRVCSDFFTADFEQTFVPYVLVAAI